MPLTLIWGQRLIFHQNLPWIMNSVLFIHSDKSAECLKRGLSWKVWGFQLKTCSCLTCLIHFHGQCSWTRWRSQPDVSPVNMKADTSGTFDKSELHFWCFDGDCHQLPRAQIYLLVLWALLTKRSCWNHSSVQWLMLMPLSLLTLFGVLQVQALSGTIQNSREQQIQTDWGNVQQRQHQRGKG